MGTTSSPWPRSRCSRTTRAAWTARWGWGFTIVMVIVWPVLSLPAGVFDKDYWAFWVFLSIGWAFVATFVIIALPLYEPMDAITGVCLWMIGKPRAKEVPDTPQQPATTI